MLLKKEKKRNDKKTKPKTKHNSPKKKKKTNKKNPTTSSFAWTRKFLPIGLVLEGWINSRESGVAGAVSGWVLVVRVGASFPGGKFEWTEVSGGFGEGSALSHHGLQPAEIQGTGRGGAHLGGGEPGQREGADGQAEAADPQTLVPGVGSPGEGAALGCSDPRGHLWGRAEPRAPQGAAGWWRVWLCHRRGGSGVAQDGAAGNAGSGPAPGAAADAAAGAAAPAEGGAGLPPAQGDAGRCHLRPRGLRGRLGPALQHPPQGRLPSLHAAQAHRRHPHEHQLPALLPLLSHTRRLRGSRGCFGAQGSLPKSLRTRGRRRRAVGLLPG